MGTTEGTTDCVDEQFSGAAGGISRDEELFGTAAAISKEVPFGVTAVVFCFIQGLRNTMMGPLKPKEV